MSRKDFKVTTKGNLLGVKVNVTGAYLGKLFRNAPTSNKKLMRGLMPLYREVLKGRTKKLSSIMVLGGRGVTGTKAFESTPTKGHTIHKQISDPWSRLMGDRSLKVTIKTSASKLNISVGFKNTRTRTINFHNDMKKVPRASTVAARLDATCLPYIRDGHMAKALELWSEGTTKTLAWATTYFFEDRATAASKVKKMVGT
jgi:hypothetical protein